MQLKNSLKIKDRLKIIKLVLPIMAAGIFVYLKYNYWNLYIFSIALILLIAGIIIPSLAIILDRALMSVIDVFRIIITFVFTIFMQFLLFPIIRITVFLLRKRFFVMHMDKNSKTYYTKANNSWKDNINEPF